MNQIDRRLSRLEVEAGTRAQKMRGRIAIIEALMAVPGLAQQPPLVERLTYWVNQDSDPRRRRIAELLQVARERYEQAN